MALSPGQTRPVPPQRGRRRRQLRVDAAFSAGVFVHLMLIASVLSDAHCFCNISIVFARPGTSSKTLLQ